MQKRYRPFRTSDIARCEVLVTYELLAENLTVYSKILGSQPANS